MVVGVARFAQLAIYAFKVLKNCISFTQPLLPKNATPSKTVCKPFTIF